MPTASVEERLTRLESLVSRLVEDQQAGDSEPWWERHFGAFRDNPLFDEAMRLGAEYRRAQPTAADPDAGLSG